MNIWRATSWKRLVRMLCWFVAIFGQTGHNFSGTPCMHAVRLTKKTQTAQNKCIRFCLNLNNRAHVGIKEFKDINWLPTKERFEQCTATNVFKFFDNSAPSYMSEMFSPVCQGRITRRSKNRLHLPFRKTNAGQNGLSYIGPRLWNSLQSGLKSSNNVNSFNHKIKDKFFNDLQNRENSPYIYY